MIVTSDLVDRIRPYTVIDRTRLWNLIAQLERIAGVPGEIVECGVAGGGSAALLAAVSARPIWLFDSFQGLPEPTLLDGPEATAYVGANQSSVAIVEDALRTAGVDLMRVTIRAGWFDETFTQAPAPDTIALLHIDADWYRSVRLCLERWYDAVSPGGIIVLDDYGFWTGCRHAFYEFVAQRGLDPILERCGDQGFWVKA